MYEVSRETYEALEVLGEATVRELAGAVERARRLHPVFALTPAEAAAVVYNEASELVASVHDRESPDRQHAEAVDTVVTGLRFMGLEWMPKFGSERPAPASGAVETHFDSEDDFEGASEAPVAQDMVNRPSHYTAYPVEVIDMIKAVLGLDGFKAYCLGNEIKYRMRAGLKGDPGEDLAKAMKYKEFRNAAV